eukprot:COSAG02_NODE_21427_length_788_cov_1.126270_2_plen_104_part_00
MLGLELAQESSRRGERAVGLLLELGIELDSLPEPEPMPELVLKPLVLALVLVLESVCPLVAQIQTLAPFPDLQAHEPQHQYDVQKTHHRHSLRPTSRTTALSP